MTINETIDIVEKLIELTQHNKITWTIYNNNNLLLPSSEKVDISYTTNYLNKNIRVYKYYYQFWTDEETYHWIEDLRLEFYDTITGNVLFRFPKTSNFEELLSTIMYQNSGVKDFYNEMFNT